MANRMIIPCAVCKFPVEVESPVTSQEVYVEPSMLAQGNLNTSVLAVCGNPRCRRLVREVLEEEGRQKTDDGYRSRL